MLPLCDSCPTGDYDNVAESVEAYQCWVANPAYTQAYRDSKYSDNAVLLDTHLQADYGTTDKLTVVGLWIANPVDPLLLNGDWGYAHAALSLLELQDAQAAGATNAELIQLGYEQKAKWYLHEAKPRCEGDNVHPAVVEWQDPNNWYEDSKLDYYTPAIFIDWWLSQL